MGRYTGKPENILDDLNWLIKELKDEDEWVKNSLTDKRPLSGFVGFMYGLKKDFDLNEEDFLVIKSLIDLRATDLGYQSIGDMDIKNISDYCYGTFDDLLKILEAAKQFIRNKSVKFQ